MNETDLAHKITDRLRSDRKGRRASFAVAQLITVGGTNNRG